ncbi:hypothetical protein F4695_000852 [Rhizobium soli]|uniref:Uncharacterized protein n=1 Tax=Rhizobium soli TaxID=424798 RepID=A0A7X0JH64_9HYPH|nr:hypothetical protein [Rhizobium soli]
MDRLALLQSRQLQGFGRKCQAVTPTGSERQGPLSQMFEQPQQIAIRVGNDELPIADLMIAAAIPFVFRFQMKGHARCLQTLQDRARGRNLDLQVHAATEGIGGKGAAGQGKVSSDADLVDHQLRLAKRQKRKAFVRTIVDDIETDQVSLEIAAFPPVADGELGNQCVGSVPRHALVPPTVT